MHLDWHPDGTLVISLRPAALVCVGVLLALQFRAAIQRRRFAREVISLHQDASCRLLAAWARLDLVVSELAQVARGSTPTRPIHPTARPEVDDGRSHP